MTEKVVKSSNRGSKPGERRGGRKKGVPNKLTGAVKDMILQALDTAGGVKYLVEQADKNPVAFMGLVGKVLPLQLTGADGGPIKTETEVVDYRDAPTDVVRWIASQRQADQSTHH